MTRQILPPSSAILERDISDLIEGLIDIEVTIKDLWDPYRCPAELLPWLAWAVSVDQWVDSWPEAVKRKVIDESIEVHRYKGTPHAVMRALNALGVNTNIVEWWHQDGSGVPGTMKVTALINENISGDDDGIITPRMLSMITEAVNRSKRASIHFDVELGISLEESVAFSGAMAQAVGLSDRHANIAPIVPDELSSGLVVGSAVYRTDLIDTEADIRAFLPSEMIAHHSFAGGAFFTLFSDLEMKGAI